MSFMSKVSLEEARVAKEALKLKLAQDFASAGGSLINGIGIGRISTAEMCVVINLLRDPTTEEKARLPDKQDTVQIQYKVVGPIGAFEHD